MTRSGAMLSPRDVLAIEPVKRFPPERVHRVGSSSLELTGDMLRPDAPPVFVLEQSR